MTSKETLKKAEARTGLPIGVNCCIMTETEMRIIEKDLKVLEILKSHARLTELNSVYMGYPKTIVIAIEPNDDDYEIVKRWLENDK